MNMNLKQYRELHALALIYNKNLLCVQPLNKMQNQLKVLTYST